jgi:hypothetical protein
MSCQVDAELTASAAEAPARVAEAVPAPLAAEAPLPQKKRRVRRPSAELELLSARELADEFGIALKWLHRMTAQGSIPALVIRNKRLYHREVAKKAIKHLAGFSVEGSRVI